MPTPEISVLELPRYIYMAYMPRLDHLAMQDWAYNGYIGYWPNLSTGHGYRYNRYNRYLQVGVQLEYIHVQQYG